MSSPVQTSFSWAVKTQFNYKMKAYKNIFGTLMIYQLIALLFSLAGQYNSTTFMNNLEISTNSYSGDVVLSFTMIWAFVMSFILSNRKGKDDLFSFVSDKLSHHFGNVLFIIVLSVAGAVTATLMGFVIRVVIAFYYGIGQIYLFETIAFSDVILAVFVAWIYQLLVFSIGYLIGELVQLHQSLMYIIPVLLIGLFIVTINLLHEPTFITFYIFENNLFIFVSKALITIVISWFIAMRVNERMEVRK